MTEDGGAVACWEAGGRAGEATSAKMGATRGREKDRDGRETPQGFRRRGVDATRAAMTVKTVKTRGTRAKKTRAREDREPSAHLGGTERRAPEKC